ncbi:hypothetical protein COB21_01975 [Candidatus Aerophobetes bacterium]|uniref:Uncharacterized protein n=1 Tax=Aerophobetes bacterium TaxID=2030807 RepID=A0A2A4X5V8_UNCAE|nr:MAG: hypothetical protein COB21_01975 [Candidatus Aerophobetes bacterium]
MTTVIRRLVGQAAQMLSKVKTPHVAGALGALLTGSICKTLYSNHRAKQALAAKNVEMQTQVRPRSEGCESLKRVLLHADGKKLGGSGVVAVKQGLRSAQMALALMASGGGEGERKMQATITAQIAIFKECLGKYGKSCSDVAEKSAQHFVKQGLIQPAGKLRMLMKCNESIQLALATVIASDQYKKNSMGREFVYVKQAAKLKQELDRVEENLTGRISSLLTQRAQMAVALKKVSSIFSSVTDLVRGSAQQTKAMRSQLTASIAKLDGTISMLRKTLEEYPRHMLMRLRSLVNNISVK